jgi:hypothetical protein
MYGLFSSTFFGSKTGCKTGSNLVQLLNDHKKNDEELAVRGVVPGSNLIRGRKGAAWATILIVVSKCFAIWQQFPSYLVHMWLVPPTI